MGNPNLALIWEEHLYTSKILSHNFQQNRRPKNTTANSIEMWNRIQPEANRSCCLTLFHYTLLSYQ